MKLFLIAAVAVAVSGSAFAKDLKGSVMTDSEMDKVTAGGLGVDTAAGQTEFVGNAFGPLGKASDLAGRPVGLGNCTAKGCT